jgi:nitronate monooxygenase
MLNLLPRMVDAVKIPVIACGGIADARQFVAALAMGAEGVMMGTRFMLTKESLAHPNIKKALVEANEADTVIIQRSIGTQTRVLRNEAAKKVMEMEARGASLEEMLTVISGRLGREAMLNGEVDGGVLGCGQGVGLMNEALTVKEVIDNMVSEAAAILRGICSRWPLLSASGR